MPSRIMAQALLVAAIAICLPLVGCESPGGKVSVSPARRRWPARPTPGRRPGRKRRPARRQRHHARAHPDRDRHQPGRQGLPPGRSGPGQAAGLLPCRPAEQDRLLGHQHGSPGGMACGVRGCIGGYGWGMYGAPMDVDIRSINYTEGAVMLDLVDAASGKLAWRATSQKADRPEGRHPGRPERHRRRHGQDPAAGRAAGRVPRPSTPAAPSPNRISREPHGRAHQSRLHLRDLLPDARPPEADPHLLWRHPGTGRKARIGLALKSTTLAFLILVAAAVVGSALAANWRISREALTITGGFLLLIGSLKILSTCWRRPRRTTRTRRPDPAASGRSAS
jgi:hypothetical protein